MKFWEQFIRIGRDSVRIYFQPLTWVINAIRTKVLASKKPG